MALQAGARLGPYEIQAALGAGGMGEVYRARDTKLGRHVALKVLPDHFANDPDRLARFQREAQVLAALNHSNIAAIYGVEETSGMRGLAMELVEGPTLADRIAQGPVPLDEALPIAKQIAEALEAAHEQGIIHRDLKPANIKVREDGTVKVLDFGLAKLTEAGAAGGPDVSQSPTITSPVLLTGVGVLLGTAAYMSPEQAKGKQADKRSDIWAFGCVVYEMLAGRRPFDGEDMTDVLGAVCRLEPNWAVLPAEVPNAVRTLIQRCLVKDRRRRISDASVAIFILSELDSLRASQAPVAVRDVPRWRRWLPAAAVTVLSAIVGGGVTWVLRPTPTRPAVARLSFLLPEGQTLGAGATRQLVAVSHDGTRLAYVADSRIYLRSIAEPEPRAIQGTETGGGVLNPMFAPDDESIAYFETRSSTLKRIPITGGSASTIAEGGLLPCGATWGPDGIVIGRALSSTNRRGGILRIPSGGGAREDVVTSDAEELICGPQMLPGGDAVLFTVAKIAEAEDRWDMAQIVAQSLADGTRRVLIDGGSDARYLPTGHLLYALAGTMYAVPFDVRRLTVTGEAVRVVVGVRRSTPGQPTSATHLAVSETGTLVYVPGPATTPTATFGLARWDGRSDPISLKVARAAYFHPRGSPNGRALAVARIEGRNTDIWTYDLSGTTELRRVTFGGDNRFPVWSADGRQITFQSGREGDQAIWWQPVDGGRAERLTSPAEGEEHVPEAWSPDGRYLLFTVAKGQTLPPEISSGPLTCSLRVLTLDGRKTAPFGDASSTNLLGADFSPDGRWVAYGVTTAAVDSPDRGIFVEPFPATGGKYQAPRIGNRNYHPAWAPDGTRLFYKVDATLHSVSVTTRPTVAFGTPVELTSAPRPGLQGWQPRGYDVLPDGGLISVVRDAGADEVRVVLNWFEELKRLVPVN